ncbi:MAG TPA: HAMP domain-containing sensor histidine kinase [Actinomycetota bacterium]
MERAQESRADGAEEARYLEQQLTAETARAQELERRLRELEMRLEEAEAGQRVTVIVEDEERAGLKRSVAAEVRRPLTSILGLALALKHTDGSSPDGKDMVRQLATSARKLDRLVGQLLDADTLADGSLVPNRRRTNVEALVRRVIEESQELAKRDVQVEAEHVAIALDPHLAEQMIDGLLANAARRTSPGDPVWVRIASEEGGVMIAVDDGGPEVPSGLRSAMFAAVAGDGADGPGSKPTGETGLSLLARLAEIHGGRAWVEERPGGGASFRVLLSGEGDERPTEQRHLHAVARVPEPSRPTHDPTADGHEEDPDVDVGASPDADALGKLLTS